MLLLKNEMILKMSVDQGHLRKVYCSRDTKRLFYSAFIERLFPIEIFAMAVRAQIS